MPARSLKILQVLRAPTGGLWRHAADLSRELARRGHQLGMVMDSGFSDAQTQGRLDQLSESLPLGIHRVPIPRMPGPSDISAAMKLRGLTRDLGIDVVHGHGAKGGLYARLARWGNRKTVAFYTPHGGVLNYEPHSVNGRLFRKVERWLAPLTDTIVFESHFAKKAYLDQIGTPACPASVFHNGLAADEFNAVVTEDEGSDFVFIGELRAVKGIDILLDALAPLKRPDGRPATLSVIGGGPLQREIEQQIRTLGLSDRVRLFGVQTAGFAFTKGSCVVVPSLAESLPYVILEAAAAEKPLVCTRVGGVNEIFGPTETSLIPAGDTAALQIAMQQFLDAPDRADTEMRQRLAHVKAGFSIERMTDGIEQAYFKALERR